MERKSKRAATAPEATEIFLQHVFAVCPAIIYTTQASGDFECTFVSENIEQILGYTQREMRDDPDFWTSHIHPQDQRRVVSEVFGLIPKGGGSLEYRFRHRDGHYRWFQDSFRTVHDELGQPVGDCRFLGGHYPAQAGGVLSNALSGEF